MADRPLETPIFRFDAPRLELSSGGHFVSAPPKAIAMLEVLVEHAGQVVSRAELIDTVWGGLSVSADAVRHTVRQLRIALADPVDRPLFIETVARRGWRFVGAASPVEAGVWVLESVSSTGSTARGGGRMQASALVGRGSETAALRDALARAQVGDRQTVFVVGEAGIGKTSLVASFLDGIPETENITVARGECIEHFGSGLPYLPLFEALERLCSALGSQLPLAILRRHAPTWLAQLPSLTEPDERGRLAEQVQGASQERMIRELAGALDRLCETRLVILWIEDLHWADTSTLEAISFLTNRRSSARLLVIASLRTGETSESSPSFEPRVREFESQGRCRVVSPSFLGSEEIRSYLIGRFGGDSAPAESKELVESLLRIGSGSPLFTVCIVDELVDRELIVDRDGRFEMGSQTELSSVPESLRPLLAQQIESLEPELIEVLEIASVVGLDFSVLELEAALDDDLDGLEWNCDELVADGRFVLSRGSVAWPDGGVGSRYRFVHALHREVLLTRLSAGRLSRIHRAVGMRKERGFADRVDEIAAELALHFERGCDVARAVEYRARAGESSARQFSNPEATDHLCKALELAEQLPEGQREAQEIRLRIALSAPLAAVVGYGAEEVAENLKRLAELTKDIEDSPAMFPLLVGLWALNIVRGDLATTTTLCDRLLALSAQVDDPITRLQANRAAGHCLFYRGDLPGAERCFQAGLDGYDVEAHARLDYSVGDDPVVLVFSYRSWSLWYQGYSEQAIASIGTAVRHAERLGHPASLGVALTFGSVLHQLRNDVARAWEWSDRAIEVSTQEGLALWLELAQIIRDWSLANGNGPGLGVPAIRQSIAEWERTGAEIGSPHFLSLFAESLGRNNEIEEAIGLMSVVESLIAKTGQFVFAAEHQLVLGELLWRRGADEGDRSKAIQCLERATELARRGGLLPMELRSILALSDIWESRGERERAVSAVTAVYTRFEEGFNDFDLHRARSWID